MHKVDLHTHSVASHDGGLKAEHYKRVLRSGKLDAVAITDHNTISLAQRLHEELGNHIIVGEEIATSDGEIIGLFLSEVIPPGRSASETARAIKDQGGVVYIPHPFETVRSGITLSALDKIANLVDIIEVHNARAFFQNRGPEAVIWSTLNNKARAAASDAHGVRAIGHTFCAIDEIPESNTLVGLLSGHGRLNTNRPPVISLFYPKLNRIKKLFSQK